MVEQKNVVITYETLYEILRREKSREQLQQLDPSFFDDVITYLAEKQNTYDSSLKKTDMFSIAERDALAQQLANIRKILKELYERRERKLLDIALNKSRTSSSLVDTANMLPQEQTFFDETLTLLSAYREKVLHNVSAGRRPDVIVASTAVVQSKRTKHVQFLHDVDQIVGEEMELYGPFTRDDEAELPPILADILIDKGSAKEVEGQ
ncbi:DNA replication complex GINS family protein [Candidatus Woesearchaeota archaeon]|nr:DNA replication complex GINS family protein [Candidatus Woesearchaeota archaeon]